MALSLACALSVSAQTSPEWKNLEKNNKDFQGKAITFEDLVYTRDKLSNGQNPRVTVLSCSDSRVPPELVFKQNLGEIFLVRSAGNVTDTDGIASIEYAIEHHWTKLLVVLAHQKCGAVESAIATDTHKSPNLTALLRQIRGSFSGACPKETDACWTLRTKQNAIYTVDDLKRRSAIVKKAIDIDKLPVVVAYYELKSGKVVVWKTINN
ncbi:MAG TPA: carbonic anhydrase [Thermoanaerobaculia bacterium]